jgi:hypothetical protein
MLDSISEKLSNLSNWVNEHESFLNKLEYVLMGFALNGLITCVVLFETSR